MVPLAMAGLPSAGLDHGFRRLYDLDFGGAQKDFEEWERANPDDPMGPVSEAAGVLFSEFNRLGVLDAQFYEDDSIFAARKSTMPIQHNGRVLKRNSTAPKAWLSRDWTAIFATGMHCWP